MLVPQTLLQNRYQIERAVAQGGVGIVYQAVDQRLGHTVAVKQIVRTDAALRQAFEEEARLLARLRHPFLPRVSDHFVEEIGQFLVMEFVGGDDLATVLARRERPFALAEVLAWADQLLDALIYLHRRQPPVIHRDIKPRNLKLGPRGEIVLLDFGLAKGKLNGQSTRSVVGYTLHYAPLEQIRGEGTDPRSDLYALAATLYDLLTGVRPPDAVRRAAAAGGSPDPLRPLHELNPEVPPAISAILHKALALEPVKRFPDAETMRVALHQASAADATQIAHTEAASQPLAPVQTSPPKTPHNLPAQLTPLIGRTEEIAAVQAYLQRADVRLVTLTGAGGSGKTRLALAVAAALLKGYPDGVFFVALDSIQSDTTRAISSTDLVVAAVAQTLGVVERGSQPLIDSLQTHLRQKKVLLILDNFEHLIEAAPLVSELLTCCPLLKILVTSREALQVRGEQEFQVPPLALPEMDPLPTVGALLRYAAIDLFVQRTQAVQPGFALDETNARAVAVLCTHLDGLPLAIELAAARMRLFRTPQALLTRLEPRLKLLTGGPRDLPARHRTLRTAIEWSYELLTLEEQMLFRRLSVFAGGCTLEAAEQICNADGNLQIDVLDGMASLVSKSLLHAARGTDGESRFSMLETVREFAEERLVASGERSIFKHQHASVFVSLAEQAEPELRGPQQVDWLHRLDDEHDNLRAALHWSIEKNEGEMAGRLGAALALFWYLHGHLSEGRRWLAQVLDHAPSLSPSVRARVINGAGTLARDQGHYAEAIRLMEEGLALWRTLGDQAGIALALNNLGGVAVYQKEYTRAQRFFEESLALRRELGDRRGIAGSLNNLGLVALSLGDEERVQALFSESLGLYRELEDTWGVALALSNLGLVALHRGDFVQADELLKESLELFWSLKEEDNIATTLTGLAGVAGARGDPTRAARLLGAAEHLRNQIGTPLPPWDRPYVEATVASARTELGETAFAAAWAEGRALSLEQAVIHALEEK